MAGVWRCFICGRSEFVAGRESAAWLLHYMTAHTATPPPAEQFGNHTRRRRR